MYVHFLCFNWVCGTWKCQAPIALYDNWTQKKEKGFFVSSVNRFEMAMGNVILHECTKFKRLRRKDEMRRFGDHVSNECMCIFFVSIGLWYLEIPGTDTFAWYLKVPDTNSVTWKVMYFGRRQDGYKRRSLRMESHTMVW